MTFYCARARERRHQREVLYTELKHVTTRYSRSPNPGELLFTETVGGKTPHARARVPVAYSTDPIPSLIGTRSTNNRFSGAVIRYGARCPALRLSFFLYVPRCQSVRHLPRTGSRGSWWTWP